MNNRKSIYSFSLIIMLFLSACFKEDEMIEPHESGDVETATIAMTYDYRYQLYYDLSSNNVVSENLKKDWDLGFECAGNGWKVLLNTASFMYAANSGETNFENVTDTVGLNWRFDKSDGNPDSLAIGQWFNYSNVDSSYASKGEVYVINQGIDELGLYRGFKKMMIDSLSNDIYYFRFANLDGSELVSASVAKDSSCNQITYAFKNGGEVKNLEPYKYDWDLLFTQYTTLLYTDEGEAYPYIVTGTLINSTGVQVHRDTILDFANIDFDIAKELDFSTDLDIIGYEWKEVVGDVTSGVVSYVIAPKLYYVIKDFNGFYYKLRFVSFYNDQGEKGFPTFEFQQL